MSYCKGPAAAYLSDNIKLLMNNGLSGQEATVAAVFVNYNPYDTVRSNTTSWSYLIKAVQFALRESGFPVTLTGSINPPTEQYLQRIFGDWGRVSWSWILTYINKGKHNLAQKVLG